MCLASFERKMQSKKHQMKSHVQNMARVKNCSSWKPRGLAISPDDSGEDENITLQNVNKLWKLLARLFNGRMQRECK